MLRIENLVAGYGQAEVLHDLSLDVGAGEFVAIIGANGAGKTTLMKAIMGLVPATSGRILYRGGDILPLPAWERASLGIGYVPEGRRVFADLTVEENLRLGAGKTDAAGLAAGLERVCGIFPRLAERRSQAAKTMSGGEQQMLAIGRALMLSPALLLVDEISMGLMPLLVNKSFAVLRELNARGTTILLVEQNARKALAAAHRGYVLETGRIVLAGMAAELRSDPAVKKAYLGG